MAPLDFEILSKLMRYVFTFLGLVIVWRSFAWLRKDRHATHKRLKALPDAGTIGLLTVLQGSTRLREGDTISVPPEGVLGFVRTCDVVIPVTDVVAQHLDFTFRNGKGLYVYPRRGCAVSVDGVLINNRASARRHPMRHGSILQVGEALLQLGVFAGLEVEQVDGVWNDQPPHSEEQMPQMFPPVIPHPVYPPLYVPELPPVPAPDPMLPPCPPYPPQDNGQAYYQPYPPAPLTPPERRPGDDV